MYFIKKAAFKFPSREQMLESGAFAAGIGLPVGTVLYFIDKDGKSKPMLKKANLDKKALSTTTLWNAYTASAKKVSKISDYVKNTVPKITNDPVLIGKFKNRLTKAKKQKQRFLSGALRKSASNVDY